MLFVDSKYGIWVGQGDGHETPLKMLLGHIPSGKIESYANTETYYGREYGMMYPDAAEFLNSWGIKCDVRNLPPVISEQMPLPDAPD